MKVKVKLFSSIRIQVGRGELDLEIHEGATVSDLILSIENNYASQLGKVFKSKDGNYNFSISVNNQKSGFDVVLKNGDTVALLPPVSGG